MPILAFLCVCEKPECWSRYSTNIKKLIFHAMQIEYVGQHQVPLIDFPNCSSSSKHSHLTMWVQHSCSINGWVCCTLMIYLNTSAVFSESQWASKEIYVSFWIDCTLGDPMTLMFRLTYWLFFWSCAQIGTLIFWLDRKVSQFLHPADLSMATDVACMVFRFTVTLLVFVGICVSMISKFSQVGFD